MKKKSGNVILSVAAAVLMTAMTQLFFRFSYEVNDDATMIAMLSGGYSGTSDAHAVFINYPLSWLISMGYRLAASFPWYRAAMVCICTFCLQQVFLAVLKRFPRHRIPALLLSCGGFLALWVWRMCCMTFTTVSAFAASCAVVYFALMPAEENEKLLSMLSEGLMLVLAYCARTEFGLLPLPFLGVLWLFKQQGRPIALRALLVPLSAVLMLLCAFALNTAAYSGADWQTYLKESDHRSWLEDFGNFPSYKEAKFLLKELGISSAEYKADRHYDYDLTDSFSKEALEKIYDFASERKEDPSALQRLKGGAVSAWEGYTKITWEEKRSLLVPLSYLCPLLLAAAAVLLSVHSRKPSVLAGPLVLLLGLAGVWIVLGCTGRMPARVLQSMRLLTCAVCFSALDLMILRSSLMPEGKPAVRIAPYAALVTAVLCGVYTVSVQRFVGGPVSGQTELETYVQSHPEEIFVMDVRRVGDVLGSPNVFYSGGWESYSPLYKEKLEANGLSKMERGILLRENVYLVTDSEEEIRESLGLSDSAVLEAKEISRIGDAGIYRVLRAEE